MMSYSQKIFMYLVLASTMSAEMFAVELSEKISFVYKMEGEDQEKRNDMIADLWGRIIMDSSSLIKKKRPDPLPDEYYIYFDITRQQFNEAASIVNVRTDSLFNLRVVDLECIVNAFLSQQGVAYKATILTGDAESFPRRDAKVFGRGDGLVMFSEENMQEIHLILKRNDSVFPIWTLLGIVLSSFLFAYLLRTESPKSFNKEFASEQLQRRQLLGYQVTK